MNFRRYRLVVSRVLRRSAGPIALLWGLATAVILILSLSLLSQGVQWLQTGHLSAFDGFSIVAAFGAVVMLDIFRKALYRPLRRVVSGETRSLRVGEVITLAGGRIGVVLVTTMAIIAIIIALQWILGQLGLSEFSGIAMIVAGLTLQMAIYFTATHSETIEGLDRALTAARRHTGWVLGIPAVFLCLSALPGLIDSVDLYRTGVFTGDFGVVDIVRALSMWMIFEYLRWVTVSAAYIGVDDATTMP